LLWWGFMLLPFIVLLVVSLSESSSSLVWSSSDRGLSTRIRWFSGSLMGDFAAMRRCGMVQPVQPQPVSKKAGGRQQRRSSRSCFRRAETWRSSHRSFPTRNEGILDDAACGYLEYTNSAPACKERKEAQATTPATKEKHSSAQRKAPVNDTEMDSALKRSIPVVEKEQHVRFFSFSIRRPHTCVIQPLYIHPSIHPSMCRRPKSAGQRIETNQPKCFLYYYFYSLGWQCGIQAPVAHGPGPSPIVGNPGVFTPPDVRARSTGLFSLPFIYSFRCCTTLTGKKDVLPFGSGRGKLRVPVGRGR
jgi:hypothetical protein